MDNFDYLIDPMKVTMDDCEIVATIPSPAGLPPPSPGTSMWLQSAHMRLEEDEDEFGDWMYDNPVQDFEAAPLTLSTGPQIKLRLDRVSSCPTPCQAAAPESEFGILLTAHDVTPPQEEVLPDMLVLAQYPVLLAARPWFLGYHAMTLWVLATL